MSESFSEISGKLLFKISRPVEPKDDDDDDDDCSQRRHIPSLTYKNRTIFVNKPNNFFLLPPGALNCSRRKSSQSL